MVEQLVYCPICKDSTVQRLYPRYNLIKCDACASCFVIENNRMFGVRYYTLEPKIVDKKD